MIVRLLQQLPLSMTDMDPAEKALMSLPSPLTASDEWVKPRETTIEVVRVTAGLHRQVWVSGTSIYVDVHVANNSNWRGTYYATNMSVQCKGHLHNLRS
jgi:hypothetical protein